MWLLYQSIVTLLYLLTLYFLKHKFYTDSEYKEPIKYIVSDLIVMYILVSIPLVGLVILIAMVSTFIEDTKVKKTYYNSESATLYYKKGRFEKFLQKEI